MDSWQNKNALTTGQLNALLKQLVDGAMENPESLIAQRQALESIEDPAELHALICELSRAFHARVQASESVAEAARAAAEAERTARERAEAQANAMISTNGQLQTSLEALKEAAGGRLVELMDGHDRPIRQLLTEFYASKGFSRKTQLSYDFAFRRFAEIVGDKPVSTITRNDVVEFVLTLEAQLSNKRQRNSLKATTTKKYLSHIKEFFKVQLGKNRVRLNPAVGVTATEKGARQAAYEERRPFTPSEMQAILNAPVFRGCKSPKRIGQPGAYQCRDGRFWYGLVKMFTGCRNAELEALEVEDVVEHHGIWHLDIHKEHKTAAGSRLMPLHSTLIKAGFLDWVARRRGESHDRRLFEKRKYGTIWNERILPDAGVKKDENCIYSLRHNFDDGLKEIVQDKTRHRLMGHMGKDMGSRYGNGTVTRAQAEAIERLDLGDVDFSFLFKYASVDEALDAARL